MMDDDDIEFMLLDLQKPFRDDTLSEWARNFIQSLAEQWEEKRWLSEKQLAILVKIYNED